MRLLALILLLVLACSPVPAPSLSATFTYDDGKGQQVQLQGQEVKVTSPHFEALQYSLPSDNPARRVAEYETRIAQGQQAESGARIGVGQHQVAADSVPEARVVLENLIPVADGIGPDSAWVGGRLGRQSAETGFWTLTAAGTTYVLSDNPPEAMKAGDQVLVTGQVDTDQMSAANAGPVYKASQWRVFKP